MSRKSSWMVGAALSSVALLFTGCEGPAGSEGKAGPPGGNALVRTTTEPASKTCPGGGIKVEVGLDANANGTLEDGEVTAAATSYVCNGTAAGKSALVKTSAEPAGTNCAGGGIKIETGVDADGNGTLEPTEIVAAQTTYVCNGAAASGPTGITSPSTGLKIEVKSVSTKAGDPITVRFLLKDDRGFPVDMAGNFSVNTPIAPRFALAWFTKDKDGNVLPLNVYTKSNSATNPTPNPTAYAPSATATTAGTIKENGVGAGDYTYTFPSTDTEPGPRKVAYDATKLDETHVVWIQASRQTDLVFPTNANTFFAANQDYYFIPSGKGTPLSREIVSNDGCIKCHSKFKPETTTSNAFHGGGRINALFCNVCHNPDRKSNPAANSATFVHRIHRGEHLQPANIFDGIAATYPQDIRNCDACHKGAAQGAQAQTRPTIASCGSCHDYVDFAASTKPACTNPVTVDANGLPVPCKHVGGAQADDTGCAGCHKADSVLAKHEPVIPPDPKNGLIVTGGSNNTNAAYVAATGFVPKGAAVITYDVKSVDAVADDTIKPNKRLAITFKLKKDGKDVVFQTYAAGTTTELMAGFVGSPSVYFAFAVPQDGIEKPADFNASASGYIKNIWNGTATGTAAGTITGPDASGYYTIKLTGVQLPEKATMLTGGLGYSYNISTALPLTQIDLPAYPYTADKKQGGLVVPPPNVWKVATGFTGRRAIVDNAKCKNCHGTLGVAPSFHAGQRNDGPTCSFCHTPNRASSGWSAGSEYFIHAVHAGRKRTQHFTWHATKKGPGYGEIEFPSPLNDCKVCHVANTYDLTASANLTALANRTVITTATGKYNSDPLVNSTYYTLAPYVVADNLKDYGAGFSFAGATGLATQAAGTTLVMSQLTGVCSACHDSPVARTHMTTHGGSFYAPRSQVLAAGNTEQCMMCHGPGRIGAIGLVHQR
ncbi:MAG: OmcA/MtrC family decaheme c-type cytochrome [Deltaproteobacteria bacterium]|nr:OmcA/MtrC family decaheme c-type cytochrome [Deltaproteobacteria bacterium]